MKTQRYKVDLSRHIAECDANYARMHRLMPELFDRDVRHLWLPLPGDDERELEFRVTERCPYTTTLVVRFVLPEGSWGALIPAPSLTVRLYHDARTAEVLAYQGQDRFHGKYDYPNEQMRQPDEKAQLNRFLGEYLSLCLSHGLHAEPVTTS